MYLKIHKENIAINGEYTLVATNAFGKVERSINISFNEGKQRMAHSLIINYPLALMNTNLKMLTSTTFFLAFYLSYLSCDQPSIGNCALPETGQFSGSYSAACPQ